MNFERTINIKDQIEIIKANYKVGQEYRDGRAIPLFFWGLPGVGKSAAFVQAAEQLANKYNRRFVLNPTAEDFHGGHLDEIFFLADHRLSQELPVDSRGLVARHPKYPDYMGWLPPIHFPPDVPNVMGIILYDELPHASKAVQSAYFQIIHDRRVGDIPLPNGVMQCAAGNPPEALGQFNSVPPALMNRFINFTVKCDAKEWVDWAITTGIHPHIIMFMSFYGDEWLHKFDPMKDDLKAFPSPRSWEFVDSIMEYPDQYRVIALTGAIGIAAAAQFEAYFKIVNELPDLMSILNGKKKIYPDKKDVQFALIGALIVNLEQQYSTNFISYILGLPREFTVMALKVALRQGHMYLVEEPEMKSWMRLHHRDIVPV